MGMILSLTGTNSSTGNNCDCDEQNVPGTEAELFYVPNCEVDTYPPTLEESGNGTGAMADAVTLDGDIVLDAVTPGKGYWRKFEIIEYSGKVMDTAVGEIGSKSFDTDVPFRIKGTEAEQVGFAKLILNCKGLWKIRTKNGDERVIGNPSNPAFVESLILDTGDTSDSANQGTYLIRANTGCPGMFYNGVTDLTPNP